MSLYKSPGHNPLARDMEHRRVADKLESGQTLLRSDIDALVKAIEALGGTVTLPSSKPTQQSYSGQISGG